MLEKTDFQAATSGLRKVLPEKIFEAGSTRRVRGSATDTDGWQASFGSLNGDPAIDIELWLDRSLGEGDRSFWIGFGADDPAAMQRLMQHAPLHLKPHLRIDGAAYFGSEPKLYLDPALRPKDLSQPVYENYTIEGEGELYGIFFTPGERLDLARAAGFLLEVLQAAQEIETHFSDHLAALDIEAIQADRSLDDTTRARLIAARLGQGKYRQDLDGIWGGKCAATGIAQRELLRASHIKSWRTCESKEERLDARNGLLLAAHLDALFDKYLISFEDDGLIILSRRLQAKVSKSLRLSTHRIGTPLHKKTREYLQHHRDTLMHADNEKGVA